MASTQKIESLNYWRAFFATAKNCTIFDVLDHAITIAASDNSEEFSRQKTRILNTLQGFGSSDGSSSQGLEGEKAPAKPRLPPLRIRIVKKTPSSSDENKSNIKSEPCVNEAKLAKTTCDGEVKSSKRKACFDEEAIEAKLEATQRKLRDQYQEIENNKRQKSCKRLDYLPKQEFKGSSTKPHGLESSTRKRAANKLGFSSLQSSRIVGAH